MWRSRGSELCLHAFPRGCDECVEQRLELTGLPEVFRVPLNTEAERRIRDLDSFDDTIWRRRRRAQILSQSSDRLVMTAIHTTRACRAHRASECRVKE